MLERRYERPNDFEVSILLFKPEFNFLPEADKDRLKNLVESYGKTLFVFQLILDRETARKLWQEAIGHFPWAESYYNHMSSAPCIAIVLRDANLAEKLKKEIRLQMSDFISRIQKNLGCDFIPDLVHGSCPQCGLHEFQILFSQVINFIN
ncbi:MAG: hypothetical protein N2558_03375 [Patescibacteria group bacterium]|nr:hypothetical protein [Patescibacteria group bacterium]